MCIHIYIYTYVDNTSINQYRDGGKHIHIMYIHYYCYFLGAPCLGDVWYSVVV